MSLKLKNIINQFITFVKSTFARQNNLFACKYIQIAILKCFIDEKKDFHYFYDFIIEGSLLEMAK
jgi:hypothetical protein